MAGNTEAFDVDDPNIGFAMDEATVAPNIDGCEVVVVAAEPKIEP